MPAQTILLDVPKLVGLINIPSFEDEEISDQGLAELLTFVDVGPECGAAYRCWLTTLTHSHQIHEAKRLLRAIDMLRRGSNGHVLDIIRTGFGDAVRDHRCFADHHQQLLCICLFSSVEANHLESWERTLLTEIWKYLIQQVPSALAATLSRTLFGEVEDNMSTHANACVCKALDVLFGVFGGSLHDDENTPSSAVVIHVVKNLARDLITLPSVLEGIGGAIGTGDERWVMAQLVLGEQDALEAANRVAFGEDYSCEFCSISNNRLVLTVDGLERLCRKGSSGAVITEEEIATRALPALSAEEEHASCYVTRIVRGGSLTPLEWQAMENLGSRAEYANFFRMSVSLRAALGIHVRHEQRELCVGAVVSELIASNQANATGGFLFHFMHMYPSDFAEALANEPLEQPFLLKIHFRARPLALYMAQSFAQELVEILSSRSELRQSLLSAVEPAGWTVFHVLAEKRGAELVQLLLQNQIRAEEVMEILTRENECVPERTAVWWFLAQNNGASLVELLRARPEICGAMLPLANFAGWSAFHVLAEHFAFELADLLQRLPTEQLWEILDCINKCDQLQPVWWFYTEKSGAGMVELMRSRPAVRRWLMGKVNFSGWSAFHNLAEHYGLAFAQMLQALPEDEAIEMLVLLNRVSDDKTSVWWFFARLNGQHLVDLMGARPGLRNAVCQLANAAGWTALHVLAEHWGEALAGFVASLGDEETVAVLETRNTVSAASATVGCTLAKHNGPHFLGLLEADAELRARLLAANSCEVWGWVCWHVLAEFSGPALLKLLRSAALCDGEVLGVLALAGSNQTLKPRAADAPRLALASDSVCVWNLLVQHHGAGLAELLRERPAVRSALMALRPAGGEGRGVLSELASAWGCAKETAGLVRELGEEEVLAILEGEPDGRRAVLGLMASECGAELLGMLQARPPLRRWLAAKVTPAGWSAFHLLAASKDRALLQLLLAVSEQEAREILGLVNTEVELQTAVWWALAEGNGAALAELMGARPALREFVAPLANTAGWTCWHVLAEHWGEAFAGLLAALGDEEVLGILGRCNDKSADRTAVWWFLAKQNGTHMLELLKTRPEVRAGLPDLRDPRGWSAFHVLGEFWAEESQGLLAAVGRDEAQQILELRNEQDGTPVWKLMKGGEEVLAQVMADQMEP